MKRIEFVTTKEIAEMIPCSSRIGTVGFMLTGAPEEIFIEMEKRYLNEGKPSNLDLMWASGVGDGQVVRGINHLAHEGLLRKTIGGHYGLIPKLGGLVGANKVQAYNFPQGVLTSMFREMAAKRPGVLTPVGLGTFVDPDFEGGKVNGITKEDIVKKVNIDNQDYLFYRAQEIDIAIIRGTEADEDGNIGFSREALKLEHLPIAMAAKNNGGKVFVQVEKVVKNGEIDPRHVLVPGSMVDAIAVVSSTSNHMQTAGSQFNEKFITKKTELKKGEPKESKLDIRKVIGRRAAMFLDSSKHILNYGIGVPEKVAEVLAEEGLEKHFTATVEPGVIGGSAQGGLDFGSSENPLAIIEHPYQFDYYDGGGIDCTFLGMAQCNADGSLNVSKFGPKIPGCGGFINISQNSKECIFCGTFTAGGLKTEVIDGELKIIQEGRVKKFINNLEQITFNGKYESKKNKNIVIVTERAVFKVLEEGLTLVEIAPGVDLEKDILNQMEFRPIISKELKVMDEKIFKEELMGLKI